MKRKFFKDLIKNPSVYHKAYQMYNKGGILDTFINDDFGEEYFEIDGVVKDKNKIHYPRIFFDTEELLSCSCTCNERDEICSHIGVLLFEVDNFLEKRYGSKETLALKKQNEISDSLFLSYFPAEIKKTDILTLDILPIFSNYSPCLSFDISLVTSNKKYKLNSKLGTFFSNYGRYFMEFGKFFTYNPYRDIFQGWDKEFLDTLASFYTIIDYRNIPLEQFLIEENIAEKIMQLLEKSKSFSIKKLSLKSLFRIIAKKKKDGEVELKILDGHEIIPIGKSYVLLKDKHGVSSEIYCVDSREFQELKKLISIFSSEEDKLILSEKVFKENLPLINSLITLSLDEKLEKEIYIPKSIEKAIYLDGDIGNNISIEVKKIYDGIPEDELKKVVIDNSVEYDLELSEILKEYEKYQVDKKYILFQEEDIFNFITETIPQLQKRYSVYYSENLKKRRYKNLTYTGSVKVDNLLEIKFNIKDLSSEEFTYLFDSLKKKKRYLLLKDGSILKIQQNSQLEKLKEILDLCQITNEEIKSGSLTRDKNYGYFISNMVKNLKNISLDEKISTMGEDITTIKNQLEENIDFENFSFLRDYQKKGVKWLLLLKELGLGGILADDMGLGKTLQIIAYLSLMKKKKDKINLIVVPKTLLYNWQNEFKKFAPYMNIKIVDGAPSIRKITIEDCEVGTTLLTTYGMLSRDIDLYKKKNIDVIVIDEAQNIKNFLAKATNSVKQLKSDIRIALTGTPIENSTLELWSIFDFVFPGYLGKHTHFKNIYSDNLSKLRDIISPFILRRTKKMVLKELPEKIENSIEVDLDPAQKKLYQTYLKKYREELLTGDENSIEILSCIMRLRQICNHPKLFIDEYTGKSAKMEALFELLEECKSGEHRVLLFSQFTGMLNLIKEELPKGINYLYLDGKTKTEERIDLVERFNKGEGDIFLISLKAGGSGLNLTGADTVIHFDPWWNPSIEEQASDRAYRIGQEKNVNIFRIIARGTIEEKIELIKQEKKEIIKEVIDGERKDLLSMTKQDILNLLLKK